MTEVLDNIIRRKKSLLQGFSKKWFETLEKFDEDIKINCKDGTRSLYLDSIIRLAIETDKEFEDITKEDVSKFLSRDINKYTRHQYQIYFNKFFKWLGKDTKDWFIKIDKPYDKVIDPSNLWSPEEIHELIGVYPDVQPKALVAVGYDGGFRVSELININVGDVEFRVGNAVIFIRKSKTQPRRVELIFSTKYLLSWYNIRKAQCKSLDEPLWVSKSNRFKGQRLTPSGVNEILKYGCKLLGTKKHLNPHLLRHSMASYLRSRNFPDALHRIRMGLAPGSNVLERYTHVTDIQVAEGASKAFGIEPLEVKKEEPNPLLGKRCPRCGTINRLDAELCEKCFYSIDYENTGLEIELLEMYRTKFSKMAKLDTLFKDYRHFKKELILVEAFKQLILGSDKIETDTLRRYFVRNYELNDDQVIQFLETLMQEDIIEVKDDWILVDLDKLEDLIQSCKEFVSLDSKYKVSKE